MGQSKPFSAADDNAWLSHLVETMEHAEQMHDEPCQKAVLSATLARLQRPAIGPRNTIRRGKLFELPF